MNNAATIGEHDRGVYTVGWCVAIKILIVWCLCVSCVMWVPMSAYANDGKLLQSALKGRTATVQALLSEGADVNARERGGATPLMLAAFKGHLDTVQALLAAGADVDAREKNGSTALMLAIPPGYTDIVRALLAAGANVNIKNSVGWTALMLAAKKGRINIVQALLAANVDVNARNDQNQTALMLADPSASAQLVQLLTQPATDVVRRPVSSPIVVASREYRRVAPSTPTAPGPDSETELAANFFAHYHALVIGNNNYVHLPSLKTAVGDATAVAQVLKADYGFKVRLLLNATRTELIAAFDDLRATLGEHDNLIIYYAGHGYLDDGADRGYWLPINAQPDSRANWLSNADITDTLKALKSRHVMVVSDSCYSGTLTRGLKTVELKTVTDRTAHLLRMARKRSRTVLASGDLEPVLDSGVGKHSVFAAAFLTALQDNNGILDGQELFFQVRERVTANAQQTPQYEDIRLAGHEGGDFLFVRKR